jgi:hypothetical protein
MKRMMLTGTGHVGRRHRARRSSDVDDPSLLGECLGLSSVQGRDLNARVKIKYVYWQYWRSLRDAGGHWSFKYQGELYYIGDHLQVSLLRQRPRKLQSHLANSLLHFEN